MRKLLLFLLLSLSTFVSAQNEVLTNKEIIDMKELGFSDKVIITKIETSSETNFCTEIDTLKSLKSKGISDDILVAIMGKRQMIEEPQAAQKSISDSLGIGLYMMDKSKIFTKINPSVFSGTKTNTLASAFTYGIADSEISSTIDKPYSDTYTKNKNPNFFFFFEKEEGDTKPTTGNWPFVQGSSPNEFVLVRLYATSKKRKMRTGKVNLFAGVSMGVNEDDIIVFTAIPINSRAFKIVLNAPLPPGEYGFVYNGSPVGHALYSRTIYDFSIEE